MRTFPNKSATPAEATRESGRGAQGRARGGRLREADGGPGVMPPAVGEALRSQGRPLDAETRALMESRFGHDFSGVKVHTGGRAAEASSALGARAFTYGPEVLFGRGEYAPHTGPGLRLLAHELTHVVQQRAGVRLKGVVGEDGDAYERQADEAAARVAAGLSAAPALEGNALAQSSASPPVVQRQALEPQEGGPGKGTDLMLNWPRWQPQAGGVGKESAADEWLSIIPDAKPKAGHKARKAVRGVKSAHGALADYDSGEFSYHKEGKKGEEQEVAEAGGLAPGVTQADVDKAVARIKAAREKVHQRYMRKVSGDYSGFMATPALDSALSSEMAKKKPRSWATKEAAAHPDWRQGADASRDYGAWLATAVPTSVKDPAEKKWLVYKRMMPWEGDPSTINAYDNANVTWGSGFSATGSGGQLQELTQLVLDKSPEAREAFLHAGLAVGAGKEFVVVDTEKKWKLSGADADLYIRSNPTLLSLMINVAQGSFQEEFAGGAKQPPLPPGWHPPLAAPQQPAAKGPRQAALDANYETFLAHALKGVPDEVMKEWSADEVALAAHAVHGAPGVFKWKDLAKLSPHTLADIGEYVYDRSSKARFEAIVVPKEWRQLVLDRKAKAEAAAKVKG